MYTLREMDKGPEGRQTARRGTPSRKQLRRPPARGHGGNSRYSARYLILVYSNTPERFDPLEIQRLVTQEQGQCTIVQKSAASESPGNGGAGGVMTTSYLVFVDFAGKRFQTRNLGLFDVQGLHPKWLHVRSSPWERLAELMSRGDVVWDGLSASTLSPSEFHGSSQNSDPTSSSGWELLGSSSNETEMLELCAKHMGSSISSSLSSLPPLPQEQAEQPPDLESILSPDPELPMPVKDRHHVHRDYDCSQTTELAPDIESWKAGYRNGYRDALLDIRTPRSDRVGLISK
ncbi:hypothetical protein ACO1O0_002285 [Amphichorda felina]